MGAPGIPVPPVTPPVRDPARILVIIFLGPLYELPNTITVVVNKINKPIIFFIIKGSAFTKKDKPIKTEIEPDIERGVTSLQSTFFSEFGSIVAAPRMYIGVIIPTAIIGPNKITNTGTEIVPPPKPEYPWIMPLIDNIIADITKFLRLIS